MTGALHRLRSVAPALVLILALPSAVLGGRAWRLDVTPVAIFVNTETNIRLTVTNTGDDGGGSEISCVRVQVPTTFDISGVEIVSVRSQTAGTAFDAWIPVWTGGNVVAFKEPRDDYPLIGSTPPLDQAVFRITGTSSSLLAMTWTVTAADKPDHADTTKCGSGASDKTPTIAVVPLSGPTPTPKPTPTPSPTPKPTPTPTPVPTPKPTATPTKTPPPTSPPIVVLPSLPLATQPPLSATPAPSARPPSPAPSVSASRNPGATERPAPTSPDRGTGGSPDVPERTPHGGFGLAGGGESDGGAAPVDGIGGTAISVLQQMPGGLLPFAGPAFVLAAPGLLVIIAVGAQAFGALAWLSVARRKLGAFGIRGPKASP